MSGEIYTQLLPKLSNSLSIPLRNHRYSSFQFTGNFGEKTGGDMDPKPEVQTMYLHSINISQLI